MNDSQNPWMVRLLIGFAALMIVFLTGALGIGIVSLGRFAELW